MIKKWIPTTRERAALTRIYGDEENWLGVTTRPSLKRRSEIMKQQRHERMGLHA